MAVKVVAVEVIHTVTTTSWSPLDCEGIIASVVNLPDASVAIGSGSGTETPSKVKDAMLVKGRNPEPVTVTAWPGSAD